LQIESDARQLGLGEFIMKILEELCQT